MSKYKLICIDMDGTLLNNEGEVSEENKLALEKAKDKGIEIAITTGRIYYSAKYFSDLIGINTPIISSNGAYVKRKDDDKVIFENPIPKDTLLKIYELVKGHGLHINFNTWDTVIREEELPSDHAYVLTNNMLSENEQIKFIVNEDLIPSLHELDGKILKGIVIDSVNKDKLIAAKEDIIKHFGDKLHVVSSGHDNFEIMLGTSSKGNAVKELAKDLGISRDEVMCIGDSENDLSMIQYAGLGVAMGNAFDSLKEAADYITDSNVNNGVAKAIEKFIL